MGQLSWGRRYLMCPPHHFGVLYEINPWMHEEVAVEHDVASQQWNDLVAALLEEGAAEQRDRERRMQPGRVEEGDADLIETPRDRVRAGSARQRRHRPRVQGTL